MPGTINRDVCLRASWPNTKTEAGQFSVPQYKFFLTRGGSVDCTLGELCTWHVMIASMLGKHPGITDYGNAGQRVQWE